jgi:hypothetical protein
MPLVRALIAVEVCDAAAERHEKLVGLTKSLSARQADEEAKWGAVKGK